MSDWLTWQIVDSAFPTGAFAHSWGLEAAWQHGEVSNLSSLRAFLDASVQQTGFAVLPLLNAAYARTGDLEGLDALADAFTLNVVANRASRVQGRSLLATATRIWPSDPLLALKRQAEATCSHLAPVSGAVFRIVGLSLSAAQKVALYGTARGVLTAAVRLGIVGSFEAQRLQFSCGPLLESVAERCHALTPDDLAQTAPIVDLLQSSHDRLYSRLFQS
ncbi:MAG: urease accessory protein UreF [Acidobacteria bacterium]|nr:urease accessory protein UreF [Acidobacteriota bacterium]